MPCTEKNGKLPAPSFRLVDSQSVKTAYASEGRGYDGNKETKGRKRHIVVGTLGNLVAVLVHAANEHDTKAGCDVLKGRRNTRRWRRFPATRATAAPPSSSSRRR